MLGIDAVFGGFGICVFDVCAFDPVDMVCGAFVVNNDVFILVFFVIVINIGAIGMLVGVIDIVC